MNLMRTTLDVTKVEIVLIVVASLLLGGTITGLTVNHYANKATKNAVMNAVKSCKEGKVNASTLLNVEVE